MSILKQQSFSGPISGEQRHSKPEWPGTRLRFIASLNPSRPTVTALGPDTEVSFIPMDAIGDDGSIRLDQTCRVADVSQGYTFFADGDVVIAKITPCFENSKGALANGLLNGVAFGTTELIVVRPCPEQAYGPFLHWLFTSPDFRLHATAAMYGAGGQKRVPDDIVRDYVVALPSLGEQRNICAFLHRETAKIDSLIVEQERLIALLAEKRQAVISHAVTKGLNPSVPMKESGVAWLGSVPSDWSILPLKRCLSEPITYGANEAADDDTPGRPRYIRITDIATNGQLHQDTFRSLSAEVAAPYLLSDGDILLARSGATVGKSFVYKAEWGVCCFAGYLVRARLSPERLLCNFAEHLFRSAPYWKQIAGEQIQSTIPNMSAERYARMVFAFPPVQEQAKIADYLNERVLEYNSLISQAERAIELLRERRSALISAAVTGKIDVRGLVETTTPVQAAAA